jgi:molybdate transport system substrate-binding protein
VKSRPGGLLTTVALVLVACSGTATWAPTAAPTAARGGVPGASLTIYGAASLTAVLGKVKTAYETAHPGATLSISTDSSSALETKIEQGAPADVFLSADATNPQNLVAKGLAGGPPTEFAGNLLTVIVPSANRAGVTSAADLARPGVKVIAAGDAVPIRKYADRLVANLATEPGYPADFVAKYTANIASKEDNVAAVVTKVELDEGDAGIVYVTDARTSTTVATVIVPPTANVPATYSGVTLKGASNPAAAAAFLAWFAGPDGQAILAGFGFLPPS